MSFNPCSHVWKVVKRYPYKEYCPGGPLYKYKCKKCGEEAFGHFDIKDEGD